jgi:hypothetical protein
LKTSSLPSRDQFGASKCARAWYTTRRSFEAIAIVSSVLSSTGSPVAFGLPIVSSTFEKTAVSLTASSWAQTPRPTRTGSASLILKEPPAAASGWPSGAIERDT